MITVAILIIAFIVYPSLRFAASLASNGRARHLKTIRQQTGGLPTTLLRGMVTAMAADLILLPLYALAWFRTFGDNGRGTPVILVHGLFHNASAWLVMMHRLNQAGYHNLQTYQYDSFFDSFDPAVEGLKVRLDGILGPHPDTKVILIGHSLGGLVCRAVAGDPRYRDRIAGLMALGTPHHGSELAWLGGNRMSRGLIPGRSILQTVEALPDPDCPKLAVYTPLDDFVFPLNMLQPGRAGWEERICPPMGHVWMLLSGTIFRMVKDFLERVER